MNGNKEDRSSHRGSSRIHAGRPGSRRSGSGPSTTGAGAGAAESSSPLPGPTVAHLSSIGEAENEADDVEHPSSVPGAAASAATPAGPQVQTVSKSKRPSPSPPQSPTGKAASANPTAATRELHSAASLAQLPLPAVIAADAALGKDGIAGRLLPRLTTSEARRLLGSLSPSQLREVLPVGKPFPPNVVSAFVAGAVSGRYRILFFTFACMDIRRSAYCCVGCLVGELRFPWPATRRGSFARASDFGVPKLRRVKGTQFVACWYREDCLD